MRILSYHLWRCRVREDRLREADAVAAVWHVYSEYYLPSDGCVIYRRQRPILNRARMAVRLLKKLPIDEVRPESHSAAE